MGFPNWESFRRAMQACNKATFTPNRKKTLRGKVNQAKGEKHRLDRSNTEDYAWWSAIAEIDRLRDDCERIADDNNADRTIR